MLLDQLKVGSAVLDIRSNDGLGAVAKTLVTKYPFFANMSPK
jgi:hypothetical protein